MRRICSFWLVLCGMFLAGQVPALAQVHFIIENQTGFAIVAVYLSPTGTNDWEEDVLGRGNLADEDSATIHLPSGSHTRYWDLKVVFKGGRSAEWGGLDLYKIEGVKLYYDEDKDETTAETF